MPFYGNDKIVGHWEGEVEVKLTIEDLDLDPSEDELPFQATYLHVVSPFSKDSIGWLTADDVKVLIKNLSEAHEKQIALNKELGWKE